MMKKVAAMLLCGALFLGSGLTACAAPRQMADGALFDAEWYAARYPDVAWAYQGNLSPEALYQHYVVAGSKEGRLPYLMSADSQNKDAQNYGEYQASPVTSYLYENQTGGLTRVEYIVGHFDYAAQSNVDSRVVVEDYDGSFNLLSSRIIPMELPVWGGFYAGEKYNFVIFGQENRDENDSVEVVRVVKYSKDWQRLGQASLYGANTISPFAYGSLRCAEYGDSLYIRTCHQMYKSSDGLNHQASMTLTVRQGDMEITDSYYDVGNLRYGYVSHSFNQFILVDKDRNIVMLDQGDVYPRGIVIMRRDSAVTADDYFNYFFGGGTSSSMVLTFAENAEVYQRTGACIGGLAETASGYVAAFNYDGQGGNGKFSDRAVYIGYTDKGGFNSKVTQITAAGMKTPVLAPLGLDGGFVMWTDEDGAFYYARYGAGGEIAEICSAVAELSDCQPILYNGELVWYVTSKEWVQTSGIDGNYVGKLTFYRLNPATGEIAKSTPDEPTPAPAPVEPATPAYSEAEVIAIYEGALRAAGMRKPEELYSAEDMAGSNPDAGMGWAISDVPINDVQGFAARDVSALQYGGYNMYYLETLGSSDGYVRLKVYRGTKRT